MVGGAVGAGRVRWWNRCCYRADDGSAEKYRDGGLSYCCFDAGE